MYVYIESFGRAQMASTAHAYAHALGCTIDWTSRRLAAKANRHHPAHARTTTATPRVIIAETAALHCDEPFAV